MRHSWWASTRTSRSGQGIRPKLGPKLPDTDEDCAGLLGIVGSGKVNKHALFCTSRDAARLPPPSFNTGALNHSATLPSQRSQALSGGAKRTKLKDRCRYQRADGEWKLGKTPRVLYRLPETIAVVKAGKRLDICEGENDADTATALRYVAITNPEGINKWLPRFDAVLAGAADVVIVSDNDAHGEGQAFAAEKAERKVATRVRVIIFSQKDLTEQAGGTREQLDALIEAAPNYTPDSNKIPA